ncbi:MAG: hypothetical protein FD176_886 [Rhodospirillaceae bacterium]|nr:MAG: hypothetical protein FD176_886 [Rhodospirillaceae bacterium]TNC97849.1 MAG: hypothetical protein FD119_837 [Stygiobacter sp.]
MFAPPSPSTAATAAPSSRPAAAPTTAAQAPAHAYHYAASPMQRMPAGPPIQRQTVIEYGPLTNFTYQWGPKKSDKASGNVATSMHAELDPNDPKAGTDTGGSNAFDTLFQALQAHTNSTWVRGHLLNHDLGGVALYNNLFPITTAANGEHYQEVEKNVKHWVANGCEVTYDVDANHRGDSPDGVFVCDAEVTSDPNNTGLAGAKIEKAIFSHGEGKATTERVYGNKNDTEVTKYSGVQMGKGNTVLRDEYGTITKDPNWAHHGGNSTTNNRWMAHPVSLDPIDTANWGDKSKKSRSISGMKYNHAFSVEELKKWL